MKYTITLFVVCLAASVTSRPISLSTVTTTPTSAVVTLDKPPNATACRNVTVSAIELNTSESMPTATEAKRNFTRREEFIEVLGLQPTTEYAVCLKEECGVEGFKCSYAKTRNSTAGNHTMPHECGRQGGVYITILFIGVPLFLVAFALLMILLLLWGRGGLLRTKKKSTADLEAVEVNEIHIQ